MGICKAVGGSQFDLDEQRADQSYSKLEEFVKEGADLEPAEPAPDTGLQSG